MKSFNLFILFFLLFTGNLIAQSSETKISGYAQGTTYHINYIDPLHRNFENDIADLLLRFDASLSTYVPTSTISRINANDKHVQIDSLFIVCFKKAKEVWHQTQGAFDPTVYPIVNAWGFGPGKKQFLDSAIVDSMLHFVDFDLIQFKGNKILKKDKRVALDFNAFAQGYSVDVVAQFLKSKGVQSFLVEIGGEVLAGGKKIDGSLWTVGIEQPYDNKEGHNDVKAIASMHNLAMATSGNYRRYTEINGVKYAHHIDPHTGYPTQNNLLSASVFATDCISADAYATGLLVMGLEKAKTFLQQHNELQAYLIYSDEQGRFQVYQTPDLQYILTETE